MPMNGRQPGAAGAFARPYLPATAPRHNLWRPVRRKRRITGGAGRDGGMASVSMLNIGADLGKTWPPSLSDAATQPIRAEQYGEPCNHTGTATKSKRLSLAQNAQITGWRLIKPRNLWNISRDSSKVLSLTLGWKLTVSASHTSLSI